MINNLFREKVISTASLWDEEEEFVQHHVLLMGGYYSGSFGESIDYLVFDPKNDFKTEPLNKARDTISRGGQIEIITFAEFQGFVYEYIMQKRNIEGKKNIESKEFYGFSELTEIEIPEGASYIGDYAFCMCENLIEVHIPASVSVIGKGAFQGCYNLRHVTIGDGVVEIKESAFNTFPIWKNDASRTSGFGTPMQNISIDKKSKLESVLLPDSLKVIGKESFANCIELKEITLPPNLEEIGEFAFYGSGIQKYYIYDSAKGEKRNLWHSESGDGDFRHYYYNFQVAVLSKDTRTVKYVVPMYSDATWGMMECLSKAWNNENGEFDFDKLSAYFSKIKKPETKAKIAECMVQENKTMPGESLKAYESYLKRTAKKREKDRLKDPAFEIKGKKLINYIGNESTVTVPAGITEIGDKVFCSNKNIREIILPEGLISIETDIRSESSAFAWCENLEKLILPDSLTNMPDGSLRGVENQDKIQYNQYDNGLYLGNEKNPYVCLVKTVSKNINKIIVPEGCRIICAYAFDDCKDLKNISLPDSIVRIEDEGYTSKWNPRKDVYLRRELKMNMPTNYLRRADKLPSTFTYDLITTKWRDEVTIEDFTWLYLYQSSKTLDEICAKKMKADPNTAVKEMVKALKQTPKKASYKKAAEFTSKFKDQIELPTAKVLYEGAVSAKSKDAADLLSFAVDTEAGPEELSVIVAESKHVVVEGSKVVIADGVTIIPKGFLDPYCNNKTKEIVLPDSVKLLDESKFPSDIKINMPAGYALTKDKLPPKFTCELMSRQWYKSMTLKDYAFLYVFQSGANFKELCMFELEWNPDASVQEMTGVLRDGGNAGQYLKVAEFIENNQSFISKETTNTFLNEAKSAKAKKAVTLVEPTLKKRKRNAGKQRSEMDVYCHEHFSDYANRRTLREADIHGVPAMYYVDTDAVVSAFVSYCAIAPYIDLFKSVSDGIDLRLLPQADRVACGLEQSSFIEALKEIAQDKYTWYPQGIIPVCRYADEQTVRQIIKQIRDTNPNDGNIWAEKNDYKRAQSVATEALLLNETEEARKFAQSIGRLKEYEKIHK